MADKTFFINNGPFNLEKICQLCDAELADSSKKDVSVNEIANMAKAGENEICFFYDRKAKEKAKEIKATACVTTKDLAEFVPENVIVMTAENPKLAFLKLNQAMYEEKNSGSQNCRKRKNCKNSKNRKKLLCR